MAGLEALNDRGLLFVIEGALSLAECEAQIGRIEREGPRLTTDRSGVETVRHNARAIVSDAPLAQRLFERVGPHVPALLVGMAPVGANECIRHYRYEPGDFFKPHQDTHFMRDKSERSLLSIVVYLNDDFEGGELVFPDVDKVVRPAPGLAVAFGHRMRHESRPIVRGLKYALRSDVMYRVT